ncbi:MAG: AMIN domain-containing protein, partial [Thermodesulfobacteriota bacterium]
MKRKFFQKFCHHLNEWAIILFLIFPSFSQGEIQKPEPLTINKIEVMKVAEGTRVFIEGTGPLEYSAFQRTKPLSVILDLPQTILGKLAGSIQVQDGVIKSIQNKQISALPNPYARVEIILEKPVEYAVDSIENNIIIDFVPHKPTLTVAAVEEKREEKKIEETKEVPVPKPAPLKGKLIKEIQVAAQTNFLEVGITGTEPFADLRSFKLGNPPRLVLDFPGLKNATGKRKVEVGSPWLQEIRLGEYPEKLRMVFTFPDKKIPPYTLQKEENELRIILGAKQEPAPPIAAPPQPVKIAEKEKTTEEGIKKEAQAKEIKKEETEKPAVTPPPAEKPLAQAQTPEKSPPPEAKPPAEAEKVQVSPYKGAKISLDFKDADLHNIFRLLAEVSNLNIITTDDVRGKITIRMVNVP